MVYYGRVTENGFDADIGDTLYLVRANTAMEAFDFIRFNVSRSDVPRHWPLFAPDLIFEIGNATGTGNDFRILRGPYHCHGINFSGGKWWSSEILETRRVKWTEHPSTEPPVVDSSAA